MNNENNMSNNMTDTNMNNQMNNPMMSTNQGNMGMSNNFNPAPKKKLLLPIIIVVAVIVLVGGGLFAYKTIFSSPKRVFQTTIKTVYKGISAQLTNVDRIAENFDVDNKAITLNGDLKIDTNMSNIFDFDYEVKDLQIGIKAGVDIKEEEALLGAFIKGEKEKVDGSFYFTNKKAYLETNLLDDLVYLEDEDIDIPFDEIEKMLKEYKDSKVTIADLDYVVKAVTDALADSLDSEYMEKEVEKVEVNKEEKSFTKYSYKLSDKAIKSLYENTFDKLLEDDEFIKIISNISGEDKSEVKDFLSEAKKSAKDIDFDNKVVINIYTRGLLNKFAGLSVEVDNEEVITYVDDGTDFTITLGEGKEKIEVQGTRKKDKTIITCDYEEIKITLTIKSFTQEKIDAELEVEAAGEKVKASIYYTYNETKNKIDGEYKVQVDVNGDYVTLSGNYDMTSDDSLKIPDTKDAVSSNKIDEDDLYDALAEKTSKDEVLDAILGSSITEQKNEELGLDYYGMKVVADEDEVAKIFNKSGSSVFLIGSSYYFDDEEEQAALLKDLQDLQKELDFFSYRIPLYAFEDEIADYFKDATPKCNKDTCNEEPILYLVKDGKVVDAIASPITKSELKTALASIDIK